MPPHDRLLDPSLFALRVGPLPTISTRLWRLLIGCLLVAAFGALGSYAQAGITYQLDTAQATPGETVRVKGVLFNEGDSVLSWTAPHALVLQWRNEQGHTIRSLAHSEQAAVSVSLPVNNFVTLTWKAVVPAAVRGLQAISIEGEPTLLALDTSPLENSPVAGTPANVAIIDPVGADVAQPASAPLASAYDVAQTGANASYGPAPNNVSPANPSAFERFRSGLSTFEPIYFDVGNRGGTDARFQISFKYRLRTPPDPQDAGFFDHVYLGYTQTSLWDLEGHSKPFVDTTYNPSLFWQKDTIWSPGESNFFVGLTSGVEHKSNGKSGVDSRSLNSLFIEPRFSYRFDGGSTLSFYPRIKNYFATSGNADYAAYAGHVDWNLRWAHDNGLILTALYKQGHHGRHAAQLEAAWPLRRTFLNMNGYLHVQYFKGYGETLLGYNQKSSSQIRLGLALVP